MATTSRANQEAAADTAYVVRNPRILSGEPTIRGTRIPVRSIIVAFRNYGDVTNVCEAYRLTPEVIDAALAFYAANRDEIDSYIRDNELAVYEASDQ